MGYTHYWTAKPIADWQTVCDDFAKLFAACPDLVKEYDEPQAKPLIAESHIQFNGAGDAGHETFWLDHEGEGFAFCKTAAKPYDRAVTAALIYLWAIEDFDVSSDGDASDWEAGLALARQVWPELNLNNPIPAYSAD